MMLVIKFILIFASFTPNFQVSKDLPEFKTNDHFITQNDFFTPEDTNSENYIPSLKESIIYQSIYKNPSQNIQKENSSNNNITSTLLNRLLPSLIDVPPPSV